MSGKAAVDKCVQEALVSNGVRFMEPSQDLPVFSCIFERNNKEFVILVITRETEVDIHAFIPSIEVKNVALAEAFCKQAKLLVAPIGGTLSVRSKKISLELSMPVKRGVFGGVNKSETRELFWSLFKAAVVVFETMYDDVKGFSQRTPAMLGDLIASFLKKEGVKFQESDQKSPDTFTCVFRAKSKGPMPDYIVKLEIKPGNLIEYSIWPMDLKVRDQDAAMNFCIRETLKLPGKGNQWMFKEKDVVGVQLVLTTDDVDSDDELSKQISDYFQAIHGVFAKGLDDLTKFCVDVKVVKAEITPERATQYQRSLSQYLRTQNITAEVDDNCLRFTIPELESMGVITLVKSTSTLFFFVIYKENVLASKREKIIRYMGKANVDGRGFLDMNMESGRLRYVLTIPRIDKFEPSKLSEQAFGALYRSAVNTCLTRFADIEELLTGVRPNLIGEKQPAAPVLGESSIPHTSHSAVFPTQSIPSPAPAPAPTPAPVRVKVIPSPASANEPPVKRAAVKGDSEEKVPTSPSKPKDGTNQTGSSVSSFGSGSAVGKAKPQEVKIIDKEMIIKLNENRPIGRGGAACVFEGTYCGAQVAIKQLYQDASLSSEQLWAKVQSEVSVHSGLNHPNIVTLYGICYDDDDQLSMIVVEYCDLGSLFDTFQNGFWRKKANADMSLRKQIAKDIVTGMIYLHKHGIYHGDLKPHNVLITNSKRAKIADFGISKQMIATLVSSSGHTLMYCAPEVLRGKATLKSDVYPFAFILLELLTLKAPFASVGNTFMKAYEDNWRPSVDVAGVNDVMKDLIERCWSKNPDDRPTFEEILPLLDQMDQ